MSVPCQNIPSKSLLFIRNCYCTAIIRHTTAITVTVECKQGHRRAIVVVMALIFRTRLFPPI